MYSVCATDVAENVDSKFKLKICLFQSDLCTVQFNFIELIYVDQNMQLLELALKTLHHLIKSAKYNSIYN